MKSERTTWLNFSFFVVAISMLSAVLLIFPRIGSNSFWLDEAAVANIVNVPFSQLITKAVQDSHSIIYACAVKSWSWLFGDSEASFRSFSGLFAVLLVPLMYSAAKFLFNSRRIGELAALLTGTNYFLLFYGTQNRPYTLAAFLSLCSFFCFIRWLKEPKFSKAVTYFVFTILSFFTHPWFFLIFGTEGLIFLIFIKNFTKRLQIISVLVLTALASIPAALIYFKQSRMGVNDWIGRVDFGVIFDSFRLLSYGQYWNYGLITLIAFIMFIRKRSVSKENFFINSSLAIYLLAPLGVALAVSQFKPIYQVGRYEAIVLPAMLLLLAGWWRQLFHKKVLLVVIGIIMFFSSYYIVGKKAKIAAIYGSSDKATTRYIFEQLKQSGGGQVIATELNWSTFYYYSNRFSREDKIDYKIYVYPPEINEHPGWIINSGDSKWQAKKKEEAEQLVSQLPVKDVWVILSDRYQPNSYLLEALDKKFDLAQNIPAKEPHEPTSMNQILLLKPKPANSR